MYSIQEGEKARTEPSWAGMRVDHYLKLQKNGICSNFNGNWTFDTPEEWKGLGKYMRNRNETMKLLSFPWSLLRNRILFPEMCPRAGNGYAFIDAIFIPEVGEYFLAFPDGIACFMPGYVLVKAIDF